MTNSEIQTFPKSYFESRPTEHLERTYATYAKWMLQGIPVPRSQGLMAVIKEVLDARAMDKSPDQTAG